MSFIDDFSTADVEEGIGGMDASIGFETLRPENSGSAMNDTFGFLAPYFNAERSSMYISLYYTIDLICPITSGGLACSKRCHVYWGMLFSFYPCSSAYRPH